MGLIWLGGAWLVGIGIGYGRDLRPWWPLAPWLGLALIASAALAPRGRRPLLWAALALAVFLLGTWRATPTAPIAADLPPGAIDGLRGVVADWPTRGDSGDTAIVAVDAVRIGGVWQGASARIRAEVPLAPVLGRGDRVELVGYYRPAESIDLVGFRDWLARRGLHGQFRAFSSRVATTGERNTPAARRVDALADVEERLRRHIPGAEGALATGVLLGDDHLLPEAIRDAFAATGTAHTMALSGWNITIVAGFCALLGRWLRRARSVPWLVGSISLIWAFVLFVGASPSLLRAASMGTVYLLAELVGRRGDALTALVATAALLTALDPASILDIGFQLSCAATAGLVLLSPALTDRLARLRLPRPVAAGIAATVAAEIATFPIVLHHFGRLSRVTLPANLLVEPLLPAIMLGGFLTGLASFVPGPLADLLGLLTWGPARLMLAAVETLGALPWATQRLWSPGWPLTLGLYAANAVALSARRWLPALRQLAARGLPTLARPALAPFAAGLFGGLTLSAWLLLLLR